MSGEIVLKNKIFLSFSGGQTSAYMTKKFIEKYGENHEIVTVFANTGQERDETLQFVDFCDKEYDLNVVWVEAVTHHGDRIGCTHRIVDFRTADRNGDVFEDMIRKYGIPNKAYPHCTRELKLNPMYSYLRSIGWEKGDYSTAIGIRSDEVRRVSKKAEADNIIYPLIDLWPTDKIDVNDFWEDQPFQLGLKEHEGNCSWCWKKSFKKHCTLIGENRKIFGFPAAMEALHGLKGHNVDGNRRVFFRGNISTRQLLDSADAIGSFDFDGGHADEDSGCSESCELFETK